MQRVSFILIAALALLLAACGQAEPTPTPVTVGFTFGNEFVFEPAALTVEVGAPVTLNLDNSASGLEHSFVLVAQGTDLTQPETTVETQALGGINSGKVAPGETATYSFAAPAPGVYQYVCTVAGHITGGMVGTLTVTPLGN